MRYFPYLQEEPEGRIFLYRLPSKLWVKFKYILLKHSYLSSWNNILDNFTYYNHSNNVICEYSDCYQWRFCKLPPCGSLSSHFYFLFDIAVTYISSIVIHLTHFNYNLSKSIFHHDTGWDWDLLTSICQIECKQWCQNPNIYLMSAIFSFLIF